MNTKFEGNNQMAALQTVAWFARLFLAGIFALHFGGSFALAQSFPNPVFQEVYQATPMTAQCSNPSFETGFADWTSFRAKRSGIGTAYETKVGAFAPTLSSTCLLPQSNQGHLATTEACHVIESSGIDPNLPTAGHAKTQHGSQSMRLGGNAFAPANKHSAGGLIEGTAKRFIVQSANKIYNFRYSSVMNKAHDNTIGFTGEEPYFQAIAIDPATGAIIDTFVQPASGYNPNFILSSDKPVGYDNSATANEPIMFSAWSCAKLDLSTHVGKEVIVYFVNSDCVHTGHPAYTYVDDTCATCDKPEDTGITVDKAGAELKICEPDKKTQITGNFSIPTGIAASNVKVTLEIRQGGTVLKTLTNAVFAGSAYSFDLTLADLKGLGCYDFVAILEYDVTTPSGNVVHVKKQTSEEGSKAGKDNDMCVVDCIQPPVETKACLKGDAKVTCGKTPGTFVITLVPNGAGGITPTSVQVTSLTPGVTIVSPASNYPVIGGQVKITLAGATPGQTISLQVDGSSPNPQSENGMSICCNGKIEVTIPRDMECWKSTISIVKKCEPAVMGKYPVSPVATGLGLHANCTITVTTTGPQSGPITVGDQLNGAGTVVNMTAPAPWTCTTPACSVNGANLNQTSSTTVISAIAVFANTGDAMEAKNCAKLAVAGKPKGESCVPIVVGEPGKLTVVKEASYNGTHITNVNFPIAVTCGGTVTNGSVADSAPYVQTNIALGSQCAVVEGAAPPTGLCGAGQTEVWTTTYTPATPVTVTAGGATIKVRNVLTCKKTDSTIKITKTCEPVTEVIGAINSYQSKCQITVTTTGPQTGTLQMSEGLSGGGTVNSVVSVPSPVWTCTSAGCTIAGSALNQTASTSVFNVAVTFPTQGHALESENCAKISVDQTEKDQACTIFTVGDTASISITKKVEVAGPANLTGILFPITYNCGAGAQTISLANGQTQVVNGLPAGANCTIVEPPVTANPCGGGSTSATGATWLAPIYQPSQTVVAGPGASVTVVNRVMCEDITPAKTITVIKHVVSNAPDVLPSIAYPVTATCDSTVTSINDGQTITIGNLATGTSCTITEGSLTTGVVNQAALDACGGSGAPVWTTSYVPSQMVNAGANVTITNTLDCKPVDSQIYAKKIVVNHAPNPVGPLQFPFNASCQDTNGSASVAGTYYIADGQSVPVYGYEPGRICTVNEKTIPATTACGDLKPVWTTTYSPSQTVALQPNGTLVTVTNTLDCEPASPPKGFEIKKVVVNNSPGSVAGLSFPIDLSCSYSAGTTSATQIYVDGQTRVAWNYVGGDKNCTVTEGQYPATNACGDLKPIWSTTYSPSQSLLFTSAGALVTVTNTLDCEPVVPTETGLSVRKIVVSHAPIAIGNLTFPISATCVKGTGANALDNSASHSLAHGQTQTYLPYMAGGNCTVTEGEMPATKACGNGMKPVWTKSYSPSQTFAMQPGGTLVTVTNTLDCEPIIIIKNPVCGKNQVLVKGECRNKEPVCGKNQILVRGECRNKEPVCGKNQVLVKGECRNRQPVCGKNQVLVKGECRNRQPVCGKNQVLVKGRCVNQEQKCGPRQIRVKGRCIDVPKCGFGQIPVPGTGVCVSIGIGGGPKGDQRP